MCPDHEVHVDAAHDCDRFVRGHVVTLLCLAQSSIGGFMTASATLLDVIPSEAKDLHFAPF
jgi:hypothetical protein